MESRRHAGIPAVYDVVRCAPDDYPGRCLEAVEHEHFFEVFAEGGFIARTRCTASYLDDLAVGRLLALGIISSALDVAGVVVAADGLRADVHLTPAARQVLAVRRAQGALSTELSGLHPVKPMPWSLLDVFALAAEFECDRTSHRVTRGAHSAYVCQGARVLLVREDIGRHNAVDKVLGAALREGIDLARCAVFSSGRAPEDMVAKAVRAGVPLFVTKAAPTAEGIELARACDLTLVCKVTSTSAVIVSDPMGVATGIAERQSAGARNERFGMALMA